MSIEELKKTVSVTMQGGDSQYRVEIEWYGRKYTCVSRQFHAWRRIQERSNFPDNRKVFGLTLRHAYFEFRDECLRKNGLK